MPIYKQIIARDTHGNVAQGAELAVYTVTFNGAGVPARGGLVTTLQDAEGNPIDQAVDPAPVSGEDGIIAFMLPAGGYWLTVTRGADTFDVPVFMVGRAAQFDTGADSDQLPTGGDMLEALLGSGQLVEGNDGSMLVYDHDTGALLLTPIPAEAMPPWQIDYDEGPWHGGPPFDPQRAGKVWGFGGGGGVTQATIPANANVAVPVGLVFSFLIDHPDRVFVITPETGVTFNGNDNSWAAMEPYSVVTMWKTGTDTWVGQGFVDGGE
ncbi:hypothetical protein [Roseinatronobacter alkalisoli]|uniref:Carboxypeptidase regulatory-like domain-containing protein n=1 Tax=Roseinatronobacter alkalisoli TaxID=3028235 RepID=A0ABT5TEC5_9RHOB|nr:hypothetical protein [Roseinatronobacter sp. HJB301]MDD7973449.1 hypothetical protein [Roseinatronobacter sp. HJB301]